MLDWICWALDAGALILLSLTIFLMYVLNLSFSVYKENVNYCHVLLVSPNKLLHPFSK